MARQKDEGAKAARLTITEALAETKTIKKRIEKKWAHVTQYLYRQDSFRDPLEADGGSRVAIQRERQAIGDLLERMVSIRRAIAHANDVTSIEIDGEGRTISEWLTWRREVAPGLKTSLDQINARLAQVRRDAAQKTVPVRADGAPAIGGNDVIVNVDEAGLARDIEHIETVLGTLDGKLSLLNATTFVEA